MTIRNTSYSAKPAILVISCSDARLTAQDSIDTWQRRLNFNGPIYEVRCPGGGLAMADRNSSFYQSAYESFKLLEGTAPIAEVVLAFHDDCAYFADKYGSSLSSDDERRKWKVMQEAIANVAGWSETAYVRPLHMGLPGSSHSHAQNSSRLQPAPVPPPAFVERPSYAPPPPSAPQFASMDRTGYAPPPPAATAPSAYQERPGYTPPPPQQQRMAAQPLPALPGERATLKVFDRQIEERLLQTSESAQDIIALAEGQAREQGVMPAWRVERRAQEFIALLREEGKRNVAEIRQLARSFLQFYAGRTLPRSVLRSLLAELDVELQSDGLRTPMR